MGNRHCESFSFASLDGSMFNMAVIAVFYVSPCLKSAPGFGGNVWAAALWGEPRQAAQRWGPRELCPAPWTRAVLAHGGGRRDGRPAMTVLSWPRQVSAQAAGVPAASRASPADRFCCAACSPGQEPPRWNSKTPFLLGSWESEAHVFGQPGNPGSPSRWTLVAIS